MKICAIQMTSTALWQENCDFAEERIVEAAGQGANLAILPENALLFDGPNMHSLASSKDQSRILDRFISLSKQHKIWIVIGSHPLATQPDGSVVSDNRVRQSCLVISPSSGLKYRYDKIHLFDVSVKDAIGQYQESRYIEPGEIETIVCDIDGLKVGLSICYDLRFPELYRKLVAQGAHLVLVPAAFTYQTGLAHWHTLLKARAIENQSFVIGINQCGFHTPMRQTYGHTIGYSPWGDVIGELQEIPENLYLEINVEDVIALQSSMPVLKHRRL